MIQVKNLDFSYGKVPVLEKISLTLETGKIYGLLGENGVGKTTLLSLLSGLKKPCSGSIDADGYVPFDRKPAYLSQVYYLKDEVTPVNERADKWASVCGAFWPSFSQERFLEIMGSFETDPSLYMNKMSYGQLKKCYIAFALACGANYLFMDEPSNGLDIPSKAAFRSALLKYTDDNACIVISTHQVRDIEALIDPIVILDRRAVLLNASIEQISSKLFFDYDSTPNPGCIYSEQTPGNYIQVCVNSSGKDSKVNVEALFNAVNKNKDLIKTLF